MAVNKFWVSVLIQNDGDKQAWLCACNDCQLSVDEAMKIVQKYRDNYTVLCAWIHKQQKHIHKRPVFFKCYINALGVVDRR